MVLSRLAAKCRSCPFADKCDHKKMEAFGFLPKPPLFNSASQTAADSAAEPLLRETMEIRANGEPVTVYRDDIKKQIYEGLYKHLGLQFGA